MILWLAPTRDNPPQRICAAVRRLRRRRPNSGAAPLKVHGGPAVWRVKDKDTTIYLFGTIHFLPQGVQWLDADLRHALQSSGELVTELDPAEGGKLDGLMAANGYLPAGENLRDKLSPEDRMAVRGPAGLARHPGRAVRPLQAVVRRALSVGADDQARRLRSRRGRRAGGRGYGARPAPSARRSRRSSSRSNCSTACPRTSSSPISTRWSRRSTRSSTISPRC